MMMLQLFRPTSGSNSDTRPLNPDWTLLLFLLGWNMISESPHFGLEGSHLNQTMFWGIKEDGVEKEHGITTQSPASAVIPASERVIQNPYTQRVISPTGAPVNANSERNTEAEDVSNLTKEKQIYLKIPKGYFC